MRPINAVMGPGREPTFIGTASARHADYVFYKLTRSICPRCLDLINAQILLKDGRLLLTYAARMGELDGRIYHGIEAVVSRDHGRTWDWDSRFILFRWAMHQTMHSPCSTKPVPTQRPKSKSLTTMSSIFCLNSM